MNRSTRFAVGLGVVTLVVGSFLAHAALADQEKPPPPEGAYEKIVVKDLGDLPVFSYPIELSVSDLLMSGREYSELSIKLRRDIKFMLGRYQIEDKATLQKFFRTLLAIDLVDTRWDDVRGWIEKIRELEDKEAVRLTTGLVAEALIFAHQEAMLSSDLVKFRGLFEKKFQELVFALPWDVVQDRIQQAKGRAEILSDNFVKGIAQSQLDPVVEKTGELSFDLARKVVGMRLALWMTLGVKEEQIAVYERFMDQHRVEKEDIWAEREVELDPGEDYSPVVIGIWDSGVDAAVFEEAMFLNPAEEPDGKDNDGNGFVDDIYGIAYGLDAQPTPDLLHPHGDQAGRVDEAMKHLKGVLDLQGGIDSEEGTVLKQQMSIIEPDQVEGFLDALNFCGLYSHGTHVAGIAGKGNPFAKLLAARITFDYHSVPKPVTLELAKQHALSYHQAVQYFKEHNVRVVNMSWGWTFKEIESGLEANGLGDSAEERKKLAEEIFDVLSKGLYNAMASAPGILFVGAAGNSDSDVEFDKFIPSSFELPNFLVVGAVDQAGERTSFTSTGENVVLFANGFEVDSYIPGGERMKLSGTSMAAPQVVNLAAKVMAINPGLNPVGTITLIKRGADQKEEADGLLLLNPKATIALLKQS